MSESWAAEELYCPSCGKNVHKYRNNMPVADFYCPDCKEDFELKSKKDYLGKKIVDGDYRTMLERLSADQNPSLFLLNYKNLEVVNLIIIPKYFFIPELIERRKPLSDSSIRKRWVGCNILINEIPRAGKIYYIRNKKIEDKKAVISNWKKTCFLKEERQPQSKGWLIDIMNCIDSIKKTDFTLQEIYVFESILREKHPENRHIKDKIRQQLQVLRDKGYLEFIEKGIYRVL